MEYPDNASQDTENLDQNSNIDDPIEANEVSDNNGDANNFSNGNIGDRDKSQGISLMTHLTKREKSLIKFKY